MIGPYETMLLEHRAWMATPEAKEAYKRRKELSEPTFGIIKEQMRFRRFLVRGLNNVKAEAILMAAAFNMRVLYRMWRWYLVKARQIEAVGTIMLSRCWRVNRFIVISYTKTLSYQSVKISF